MRLPCVILLAAACSSGPSALRNTAGPRSGGETALGLGQLGPRVADLVAEAYRNAPHRADPPLELQPTDGTELALLRLGAEIQIRGPLAHTEIHVAFHNAEDRRREGRFTLALPPGATVSRFAMKIGDAWREARVVGRSKARRVYEQFLHRGVDPALLERDADQRFSARVFPIAPEADVELVVAYEHAVGPQQPYALGLRGLPPVPMTLAIDRDGEMQRRESRGTPEDVAIAIPGGDTAIAAGDAFVARIGTLADGLPEPLDRVLVLVDTSASRASLMQRQAEVVRRLLGALPGDAEVAVAAFDQAVRELYRGPAAGADRVAAAILAHGALGASRLSTALGYAAGAGLARVIVIGDAVATLGERDPVRLAEIASGGRSESATDPAIDVPSNRPIDRLDVIQLGASIDLAAARAITGAGRQPGAVIDGRDLDRAMHQLAISVPAIEPISVEGGQTWPATTRGIAPGDPIFVYGTYAPPPPGAVRPSTLAIRIGARTRELVAATGDVASAPRIDRAVASAQLAALEEQLAAAAEPAAGELRTQIEQLALDHRLVSSQTSLLVLESDAQERWMLDEHPEPPPGTTPEISDEELAWLADKDLKNEVITVTGSLGDDAPWQGIFSGYVAPTCAHESVDAPTGWGEPSPQVPSVSGDRDRTPYVPPVPDAEPPPWLGPSPYAGALRDVMAAIGQRDRDAALDLAVRAWRASPTEIAALLALGEALEARGATQLAARAYGSILDLYPSRDELLRAAGERLDRLGGAARELAVEAYRRAAAERPDRPESHRRLGYALARQGRWDEAIDALAEALARAGHSSAAEIIRDDLGGVAAAAIAADPHRAEGTATRLADLGVALPTRPSLRFVVSWESDASHVDLHVRDRRGAEACRKVTQLPSGGALHAGGSDGFGPEMFEIATPGAFPYRLAAHDDLSGPDGILLGAVQIIRYDGRGQLAIEDRPFAIQSRGATIDLGAVRAIAQPSIPRDR